MKMDVQKRIPLPAYCTELDPIERFWRYLKDLACANQPWRSLEEVIKKVE
jgi:transposase